MADKAKRSTTPRRPRPICRNGHIPECETDTICKKCGSEIKNPVSPELPAKAVEVAPEECLVEQAEAAAAGGAAWCPKDLEDDVDDDDENSEWFDEMLERIRKLGDAKTKDSEQPGCSSAPEPVEERDDSFYRNLGLTRCPSGHLFPMAVGLCGDCGQRAAEFSTPKFQLLPPIPPGGKKNPDMIVFGLVKCELGHVYLKKKIRCGVCGSKEFKDTPDPSKPPKPKLTETEVCLQKYGNVFVNSKLKSPFKEPEQIFYPGSYCYGSPPKNATRAQIQAFWRKNGRGLPVRSTPVAATPPPPSGESSSTAPTATAAKKKSRKRNKSKKQK